MRKETKGHKANDDYDVKEGQKIHAHADGVVVTSPNNMRSVEEINARVPGLMLSQQQVILDLLTQDRTALVNEILEILTDEIAKAHTEPSNTTSRLTSAFNRISRLKDIANTK